MLRKKPTVFKTLVAHFANYFIIFNFVCLYSSARVTQIENSFFPQVCDWVPVKCRPTMALLQS